MQVPRLIPKYVNDKYANQCSNNFNDLIINLSFEICLFAYFVVVQ